MPHAKKRKKAKQPTKPKATVKGSAKKTRKKRPKAPPRARRREQPPAPPILNTELTSPQKTAPTPEQSNEEMIWGWAKARGIDYKNFTPRPRTYFPPAQDSPPPPPPPRELSDSQLLQARDLAVAHTREFATCDDSQAYKVYARQLLELDAAADATPNPTLFRRTYAFARRDLAPQKLPRRIAEIISRQLK